MTGFSSLKEWTRHFIKHKDIFEKKIIKVEEKGDIFLVERKDGRQKWIVGDKFSYDDKHNDPKCPQTIVCLNNPGNVKAVVEAWKELIIPAKLTVLFVNLELGEKWMLNPKVHNMIADEATLEAGLLRLMQAANGLVDEEPKKKKKQSLFEESEKGDDEGGDDGSDA